MHHYIGVAAEFSKNCMELFYANLRDQESREAVGLFQSAIIVLASYLDASAFISFGSVYEMHAWPPLRAIDSKKILACPYEIHWLQHNMGPAFAYYFAFLPRPADGKDHTSCTDYECMATQIDDANYRTKHMEPDCNCEFVGVAEDELVAILISDKIPIVRFQSSNDSLIQGKLQLIAAEPNTFYTAISHVWSDGLGNPHSNQLPTCQLQRLSSLVKDSNADQHCTFWMDTLCVPATIREGRKVAIGKMRETYSIANTVMVLDQGLQQSIIDLDWWRETSDRHTTVELGYRLLASNWARRLWTLQEAAEASRLIFRINNSFLDMRELRHRLQRTLWDFDSFSPLAKIIADKIRDNIRKPPSDFRGRWLRSVSWRQTSHEEDEVVCLAALLNLRPEDFFQTPRRHKLLNFCAP